MAANIKVHVLSVRSSTINQTDELRLRRGEEADDKELMMRIVMVKKSGDLSVGVNIELEGRYGPGQLVILQGPNVTSLVDDITLAGQKVRGGRRRWRRGGG